MALAIAPDRAARLDPRILLTRDLFPVEETLPVDEMPGGQLIRPSRVPLKVPLAVSEVLGPMLEKP